MYGCRDVGVKLYRVRDVGCKDLWGIVMNGS